MRYTVEIAGRTYTVEIEGAAVRVDGRPVSAGLDGSAASAVRRLVSRSPREFVASREGEGQWRLVAEGHRIAALVLDERGRAVRAASRGASHHQASGTLRAPMPGRVVRLLVAEGQEVAAGQGLLVVEAMKMENELRAPGGGTVRRVHVVPGDRVEKGAALVELV